MRYWLPWTLMRTSDVREATQIARSANALITALRERNVGLSKYNDQLKRENQNLRDKMADADHAVQALRPRDN